MDDSEIDYSDIPELDEKFFQNAEIRMPEPKEAVSLRIDKDVLEWFKEKGKGYQTRINAVLRTYMNATRKRTSPPKGIRKPTKPNRQSVNNR